MSAVEIILKMAEYPEYVTLIDTPGLAKLFNDLCLLALKAGEIAVAAKDSGVSLPTVGTA